MASPTTGPCEEFTTPELVRACCPDLDPAFDLTEAIQWATVILWRKSGRRFNGLCTRTVYPCQGDQCYQPDAFEQVGESVWWWSGSYAWPSYPIRNEDGWQNVPCGDTCKLPCVRVPGPISDVDEILIDGVVLDPGYYKTKAFREICRVDGGLWPCSNDLTRLPQTTIVNATVDATGGTYEIDVTIDGATETATVGATAAAAAVEAALEGLSIVGAGNVTVSGGPGDAGGTAPYVLTFVRALGRVTVTVADVNLTGGASTVTKSVQQLGHTGVGSWQITYQYGRTIPDDAQYMASLLACQVALARCGAEGCVLPQRLKEVTRQGITMAFADPLEFIDKGEVGIYEIDLWLADVNPGKVQRRARVHRADQRRRNTTFT